MKPLLVANRVRSDRVRSSDGTGLLKEAEAAIRDNLQVRTMTVIQNYAGLGLSERPIVDLLLKYAVSEDGALHAENFYRTASEEFAMSRPAFRWRHVLGLARVTASEFGRPAEGHAEALNLLGLKPAS